jgi:diguanylate cyclase
VAAPGRTDGYRRRHVGGVDVSEQAGSPRLRRVWALVAASAAVALVTTAAVVAPGVDVPETDVLVVAGLVAVAVALAERFATLTARIGDQAYSLTLSELPLVIGLFLLPSDPVLLVAARVVGGAVGMRLMRRQASHKFAFNLVHLWIETLLAIALFAAIAPRSATDGVRVTALVMALAVVIAAFGAVAVSAAASTSTGRVRGDVIIRGVRDGVGPALVTTATAVVALALAAVAPALLWAPAVIVATLILAFKAQVRMAEINGLQEKLLAFSHQITGERDVHATAVQVCEAARALVSAPMAAISLPATDDRPRTWVGADAEEQAWLDHQLDVRERGDTHGTCCPDPLRAAVMAPIDASNGTWLAVAMNPRSVDRHDRANVAMIANHAAVALTNAERGQALVAQARAAQHQATHDALTDLANRGHVLDLMQTDIATGHPFALLIIDLDDFKQINDALGHGTGDQVLVAIGRRLESLDGARAVAHLGADEFAVTISGDHETAIALADHLRELLRQPVAVDGSSVQVDSSIGIALFPEHGQTAGEVLQNADLAMYEAKEHRLGTATFGAEAGSRAIRKLAISSGFRSALHGGDVAVVFQPVLDLRTGQLVGVEALARWTHPTLGPVSPEEFVPVAEQSGLITALTHHVIDTALSWRNEWAAGGIDLRMAVNLSPRSLLDEDLPCRVADQLADHRTAPDRLTLELTESSILSDPVRTLAVLHRLRDLGVELSIDDFGTGHSSLSYLRLVPAHEVKIDRSFVMPMEEEADAVALVASILRLCHDLGFRVVAEGIETSAMRTLLSGLGCDLGQGYHIARPMPGEDLASWAIDHRLHAFGRGA